MPGLLWLWPTGQSWPAKLLACSRLTLCALWATSLLGRSRREVGGEARPDLLALWADFSKKT
jgi:hypothetical protein